MKYWLIQVFFIIMNYFTSFYELLADTSFFIIIKSKRTTGKLWNLKITSRKIYLESFHKTVAQSVENSIVLIICDSFKPTELCTLLNQNAA